MQVHKTYTFHSLEKLSFTLVLLVLCSFTSIAQDKIHLISGIIVEAKIQEVTEFNIQYKKFNNLNGPIYNVKKADVKMVIYENGEKEIYEQEKPKRQYTEKPNNSNSADENSNPDIIVSAAGENIYCTIDLIGNNIIKYHIKRSGADPKGNISMAQVTKYKKWQKWYDGYGNPVGVDNARDLARQLVLKGKTQQAIALYAELLKKDSLNAVLLAEDAYVLALAGYYEPALYRLDQSFSANLKSSDLNFYTAQVFALMGYPDLANEFWKESERNIIPEWIKPNYKELLVKNKRLLFVKPSLTSEELIAKFKIANILAAQESYIQSIAMFRELTFILPNEYLPYVGYSITLEKVGAINKSAETVEKAISVLGSSSEDYERKKILEQQLKDLRLRANKIPPNSLPGLYQPIISDINQPQVMAYAGGMVSPQVTSINFKLGYFVSNSSNASLDLGFNNTGDITYTNFGLSMYTRSKIFVTGAGLLVNSGNDNTNATLKLSVGLSTMNRNKTSSFDVFFDVNKGFKAQSITTYGISVGTSLYFGKRTSLNFNKRK